MEVTFGDKAREILREWKELIKSDEPRLDIEKKKLALYGRWLDLGYTPYELTIGLADEN